MVRVIFVDEAGRLVAVDPFSEITVQEHVFDVELMYSPSSCGHEMKHRPYGRRLDHWREGLMKIDS